MDTCKSRTHKNYADSVEGLYIQTWIASRDLEKLVQDVRDIDTATSGRLILSQEARIIDVEHRLAFGREQRNTAAMALNKHLARGCRLHAASE